MLAFDQNFPNQVQVPETPQNSQTLANLEIHPFWEKAFEDVHP